MATKKDKIGELIKRIAGLVKHNQKLNRQIQVLSSRNRELLKQIEGYEKDNVKVKKGEGATKSKMLKFQMATVLYLDIRGFSNIPKLDDSRKFADELDSLIFNFDAIARKYKMHKIKTIGDTCLYTGGVPVKNSTNPVEVVLAAYEMMQYFRERRAESHSPFIWDLSMGIHTGPVTAVLSGNMKKVTELKGDSVNVASRIGSVSFPGKIGVSANTYEFVKEFFLCDFNGKMPVKYTDELTVYYITAIRPELSEGNSGAVPDVNFTTKLRLIHFNDIQELVLDRMEKGLPDNLYYHNVKHTIDVVTEVELIGLAEGISDREILLLKTAALFHDAGHIRSYDCHEEVSVELAREFLPAYGYSSEELDVVEELIMATKMPPSPVNLLEKIICDADLDYLGRSDFIPVSNSLFNEMKEQNKVGSLEEWNKLQIKFISKHQYYTETARKLREVNKQKQIERLKALTGESPG